MLSAALKQELLNARNPTASTKPNNLPRYGEQVFEGGDWPRTWHQFTGQERAVEHLKTAIASAKARGARLDHTLLASGTPGIGKSSLARLIAADMGKGFVQVSGPIKIEEARPVLRAMRDGDVLFIDEAATLGKAEWLLTLLQDGVLTSAAGTEQMPDITVVAATTDAQVLSAALLSRFYIQPSLDTYSDAEGVQIVHQLATRMSMKPLDDELAARVAHAACNNPRQMRPVLVGLRDGWYANNRYDLDKALYLLDMTHDGLTRMAQEYMCVLLVIYSGKGGEKSVASTLGESTTPRHTEALLFQRGYLKVVPGGRELTPAGKERAHELLEAQR